MLMFRFALFTEGGGGRGTKENIKCALQLDSGRCYSIMNIFSGGTKEKCCYAVVYDKQLFLHSTVADTPIIKTQGFR